MLSREGVLDGPLPCPGPGRLSDGHALETPLPTAEAGASWGKKGSNTLPCNKRGQPPLGEDKYIVL